MVWVQSNLLTPLLNSSLRDTVPFRATVEFNFLKFFPAGNTGLNLTTVYLIC